MKIKHLINSIIILVISFTSSCLKDKGNYDYKQINEIVISGIEKSQRYEVFSFVDTLRIAPNLEGIDNHNSDRFTYEWKIMPRLGDDTKDSIDRVVSRHRN